MSKPDTARDTLARKIVRFPENLENGMTDEAIKTNVHAAMINFAKAHVKAALEAAASIQVTNGAYDFSYDKVRDFIDQEKIKNAYPENLIV